MNGGMNQPPETAVVFRLCPGPLALGRSRQRRMGGVLTVDQLPRRCCADGTVAATARAVLRSPGARFARRSLRQAAQASGP